MLKLFKFTLYIMFMSDDKGGGGGGFVISTCRLNQLQICKETENISQSL